MSNVLQVLGEPGVRIRIDAIPQYELFMSRLGLSGFRQTNGISYETNERHFDGWLSPLPFERGHGSSQASLSRENPSSSR